ncbi:MAG: transporter permease, partial [Microbacteriaceae bacterium]|nr:transporter permease [Microbacteriaceae bacterium]
IFFAVSGIVGPFAARRFGLGGAVLISAVVMVAGHFVRAASGSFAVLLVSTAVTLLGMGVCNVLLPPVVKRYFPDRIGWVTALYATIMSISTALPSLLAVPVSDALGWRFSLAIWGAVAATAILPWAMLLARHRRDTAARTLDEDREVDVPEPALTARLWRSPIALAIAVTFSVSSLSAYAAFAWLPQILVDIVGVSPAAAGTMLSVFAIAGLPASIIAPILVARLRNSSGIILAGVLFFVLGYLGLLVVPDTLTVLWVLLIGLGPILFPVCLVLINTRTRSHVGAVALSGFAQTIGYTIGATGPLLVGVLHEMSGGWTVPLIFLLITTLAGIVGAVFLARPGFVEDELDRASA